jgi:hypothetical protein
LSIMPLVLVACAAPMSWQRSEQNRW